MPAREAELAVSDPADVTCEAPRVVAHARNSQSFAGILRVVLNDVKRLKQARGFRNKATLRHGCFFRGIVNFGFACMQQISCNTSQPSVGDHVLSLRSASKARGVHGPKKPTDRPLRSIRSLAENVQISQRLPREWPRGVHLIDVLEVYEGLILEQVDHASIWL